MTPQLMTIAQIADETGLTYKGATARIRNIHAQIVTATHSRRRNAVGHLARSFSPPEPSATANT